MIRIYKLQIGDCFYIGSTKNNRFLNHKSNCFNDNYKGYDYKVYKHIRSKGITFDTFEENVKHIFICDTIEIHRADIENSFIDLSNPLCLNNRRENQNCRNYELYYKNNKEYINEKIPCEFCSKLSKRHKIKRHQRSKICLSYQKWFEVD